MRTRWHAPHRARVGGLVAGALALNQGIAAGQASGDAGVATPDDRVAIRTDYSAPPGCPSADDFEAEVRGRTTRARTAVAGEPARTFHVEILSEGHAAIGRMIVEWGGERSGARVLRGKSCSEVSSALALTAALSIDPAARLVLEPAPAPILVVALAPEPLAPPGPARAPLPEPSHVGLDLGGSAGLTQIVTPGLMPVASVYAEIAWWRAGALSPAVRVSVNASSNTLDAGRDATFTWVAGGLDLCPLRIRLGGPLDVRPCVAGEGGALHGRGRNVAQPLSASHAWWSAGGSVHVGARLSSRIGLELSGSARVPFGPLEFDFATPARGLGRTPTLSVAVGLGLFVRLL